MDHAISVEERIIRALNLLKEEKGDNVRHMTMISLAPYLMDLDPGLIARTGLKMQSEGTLHSYPNHAGHFPTWLLPEWNLKPGLHQDYEFMGESDRNIYKDSLPNEVD